MELKEKIINLAFSILLTFYLLMFLTNKLKTIIDIVFGIIAIFISYILLFSDKANLVTISHSIFVLYLLGISILSKNLNILIFNIIILIVTIITKIYFEECILYVKHPNNKAEEWCYGRGEWCINTFEKIRFLLGTPGAFEVMLIISIYRLYKLIRLK
tara:strand:+ start:13230 stop:13703 length:474 start_codon:yes stop_codon:yes gene_type:complete